MSRGKEGHDIVCITEGKTNESHRSFPVFLWKGKQGDMKIPIATEALDPSLWAHYGQFM